MTSIIGTEVQQTPNMLETTWHPGGRDSGHKGNAFRNSASRNENSHRDGQRDVRREERTGTAGKESMKKKKIEGTRGKNEGEGKSSRDRGRQIHLTGSRKLEEGSNLWTRPRQEWGKPQ